MKVVINRCWGGFSVSLEAARHMAAAGSTTAKEKIAEHEKELAAFARYKTDGTLPDGEERDSKFRTSMWDINIKYGGLPKFYGYDYERNDPLLVAAVEALGEKADGEHAALKVVEIPDGTDYEIGEYDGMEHVAEKHQTWS